MGGVVGRIHNSIGEYSNNTEENVFVAVEATNNDELKSAVKAGATILLANGEYRLTTCPAGLTLIGGGDNVVVDVQGQKFGVNGDVTIENIQLVFSNENYTGFQHTNKTHFKGCTIVGQPFLYGEEVVCDNCTFVQTSSDAYNVWTYGAKNTTFNNCVFNSAGKSVLVYTENGNNITRNVTLNNCVLNASVAVGGKAAIEIDSSLFNAQSAYCISLNNTVANGFAEGSVSGNTLWNNKKGERTTLYVDGKICLYAGATMVATADALTEALTAGKNVVLANNIALSAPIQVSDKTFSLNGNGYQIGQSSEYPAEGTTTTALIHPIRCTVNIENVVFDGLNVDSPLRTVSTKLTISNVTVVNCTRDVTGSTAQGLFRLHGENHISNCTFKNNTCPMAISLNWDGNNDLPQSVKNCLFENNTCISTAVLYYVKGAMCEVDGNKFISNNVTVTGGSNAATVYMGFTENNVITNNLFQNNTVNAGTSKRVAGGLMVGHAATITGNSFVGNTVNASTANLGNDVCASVYYASIDLSGNYWGGNAPVEGDDYYVEYSTRNEVIINDYLTVNPLN